MSIISRSDLIFTSDRFNLSKSREYFINECCYGDDAAADLETEYTVNRMEV